MGPDGKWIDKFCLDLETKQDTIYRNVVLADNAQKAEFLCGILYRDFEENQSAFEKKYAIRLGSKSLYEQLSTADTITEYLGVYYQDDNPDVPEVMKTEKRIITYKIKY